MKPTQLSCKIKVELLEYITPPQLHILQRRKAVKCWLLVDTSWADKCQWYTVSDKDIHSCLERGFPDVTVCNASVLHYWIKRGCCCVFLFRRQGDKWKAESPTQLIKWVSDNKSIFSHCVDKQYTVSALQRAVLQGLGNAILRALYR